MWRNHADFVLSRVKPRAHHPFRDGHTSFEKVVRNHFYRSMFSHANQTTSNTSAALYNGLLFRSCLVLKSYRDTRSVSQRSTLKSRRPRRVVVHHDETTRVPSIHGKDTTLQDNLMNQPQESGTLNDALELVELGVLTSRSSKQSSLSHQKKKKDTFPSNRPDREDLPPETYVHGILAKANTPMDVLDIFESEKKSFDPVNYSHALNKMVTLQFSKAPWKRTSLPLSRVQNFMTALQTRVIEEHTALAPRTLAGIAWGVAKMDFDAPDLFDHISSNALGQIERFNHGDVAQLLYAFSRSGYRPNDVLERLSTHIVKGIKHYRPFELTNILISYATLRYDVPHVFNAAEDALLQYSDSLQPQVLSNAVYAFAKAGHVNSKLFQSLIPYIFEESAHFSPQALANIMWAYETAGMYDIELFGRLAWLFGHPQHSGHATPQNLSNVAHSLSLVYRYWKHMIQKTNGGQLEVPMNSWGTKSQKGNHTSTDSTKKIKMTLPQLSKSLNIDRCFTAIARTAVRHFGAEHELLRSNKPSVQLPTTSVHSSYKPFRAHPTHAHDIAELAESFARAEFKESELASKLCLSASARFREMSAPDLHAFLQSLPFIATSHQAVQPILSLLYYKSVIKRLLTHLPAPSLAENIVTLGHVFSPPKHQLNADARQYYHGIHNMLIYSHRMEKSTACAQWCQSPLLSKLPNLCATSTKLSLDPIDPLLIFRNQSKLLDEIIFPGMKKVMSRASELPLNMLCELAYTTVQIDFTHPVKTTHKLQKQIKNMQQMKVDVIQELVHQMLERRDLRQASPESISKLLYTQTRITQLVIEENLQQSDSRLLQTLVDLVHQVLPTLTLQIKDPTYTTLAITKTSWVIAWMLFQLSKSNINLEENFASFLPIYTNFLNVASDRLASEWSGAAADKAIISESQSIAYATQLILQSHELRLNAHELQDESSQMNHWRHFICPDWKASAARSYNLVSIRGYGYSSRTK